MQKFNFDKSDVVYSVHKLSSKTLIAPIKNQTLVEKIKELERFVDTIHNKNCDLESAIINLQKFIGIEPKNE